MPHRMLLIRNSKSLGLILMLATLVACTSYSLEENRATFVSLQTEAAVASESGTEIAARAPVFKVYDALESHNRIGTPRANSKGKVWVDSERSAIFTHEQRFQIEDRQYRNLIYRVHFSEIPFSIFPFHLTAGKNVGLIFIITLNENDEPVLFTTSHTCGCYKAFITTNYTPESAFPDKWPVDTQNVYGQTLPVKLNFQGDNVDICVSIRPQEHRVMDVHACNKSEITFTHADELPLPSLRQIPDGEGATVSFFHEKGIMEGYVKGSVKGWESVSLSFVSLDPFVGTDKAYLRTETSKNTFYTSLKPWRRHDSDMANFPVFLEYWGWKL